MTAGLFPRKGTAAARSNSSGDNASSKPTLVKLDIDAFEIEALRGATHVLATRPKLAIEVHVDLFRQYHACADDLFRFVNTDG